MKLVSAIGLLALGLCLSTVTSAEPSNEQLVHVKHAVDFSVLPAESEETGVLMIELQPKLITSTSERPPVNLAVALDRSGSMKGEKLEQAKQGAIEALNRLDRRDRFSLVVYDDEVETIVSAGSIKDRREIEKKIEALTAGDTTAIYAALNQAAAEIRKHLDASYFNRIVLLSDGLANVGPQDPADFSRLAQAFVKEDISVTAIGIGRDFDELMLSSVSQAGDGNFYVVEVADDLPRFFDAELGDVTSVVARNVEIRIRFQEGSSPKVTVGRDGAISGQEVVFQIQQLYAGNDKLALVEYLAQPGADGEEREIAEITVEYTDALTSERVKTAVSAHIRFSADRAVVTASANESVNRNYVENAIAAQTRRALEQDAQGDYQKAAETLNALAPQLEARNTRLQDSYLQEQVDELRTRAKQFSERTLSRKDKLDYASQSYEMMNQQTTSSLKSAPGN